MPRGPSLQTAGRPVHPPAGRPTNRSASVAGVTDDSGAPSLDPISVQALEELDEELRLTHEAAYVPTPTAPRIIIDSCPERVFHGSFSLDRPQSDWHSTMPTPPR
ncbi:hypothetical protein PSTG_19633 [Puccinia striiformis f. sp. tritici PST-78]|uniref:Uncharacterized protein n=1 Tax=Puccinia striiformis f. sp. tritici PST-78 TaxID=1165861 RepID=A0A0L0UIZ7_9BASI|nr:hypothetical protein PSTG_19633 [Puccinia striiformis f. sp. tritici PST-78]